MQHVTEWSRIISIEQVKHALTAAMEYLWDPDSHSYPAQCDDPISFP